MNREFCCIMRQYQIIGGGEVYYCQPRRGRLFHAPRASPPPSWPILVHLVFVWQRCFHLGVFGGFLLVGCWGNEMFHVGFSRSCCFCLFAEYLSDRTVLYLLFLFCTPFRSVLVSFSLCLCSFGTPHFSLSPCCPPGFPCSQPGCSKGVHGDLAFMCVCGGGPSRRALFLAASVQHKDFWLAHFLGMSEISLLTFRLAFSSWHRIVPVIPSLYFSSICTCVCVPGAINFLVVSGPL